MIYIGGSLANPEVRKVAAKLREAGFDAFDQWTAAGEGADQRWADYAKECGLGFKDALELAFVQTAFDFDMLHLKKAEQFVLVMPAGRSGGIELGLSVGWGKPSFVLYPGEPERPDLMMKVATKVCFSVEELVDALHVHG